MALAGKFISPDQFVNYSREPLYANRFFIRLTLFISLLAGPAVLMLILALNSNLVQGQRLLALLALSVIAFESTWIIYFFAALLRKAFH